MTSDAARGKKPRDRLPRTGPRGRGRGGDGDDPSMGPDAPSPFNRGLSRAAAEHPANGPEWEGHCRMHPGRLAEKETDASQNLVEGLSFKKDLVANLHAETEAV